MRVIAVYGSSKTGKTTTVVEIVKELRLRGYSVATIKDVHMNDFAFDAVGKDTWRHWKAGAEVVGLRAPNESCLLYTSDAADEEDSVDLGGRRIIKKKKTKHKIT